MHGGQTIDEMLKEIVDLMRNGFVLPSLSDEISGSNVELAVLEAYTRFYDEVKARVEKFRVENQCPFRSVYDILPMLNVNNIQYELSFWIHNGHYFLETGSKRLEELTRELNSVEIQIKQLQRELNPHL